MTDPTEQQFRDVGFSSDAIGFPRDELALKMIAAFNNVTVDQLPPGLRYHPNANTQDAWSRVADVARKDAEAKLAEAEKEVAQLRSMVDRAANIFANCTVEDGSCGCGDSMKNHPSPMICGHSPVDYGSYVADMWVNDYRAITPSEKAST